ncbi:MULTISPECIES: septal ring lytic transglycosylase RlpA family protein [unclassified Pseudoxanthomonas]|uniref:septal ring lytic transglycosylase RlpA family protein n=1 Tax=unclassified Pseudoxanthomonas TaxID=2645906 RepID=UPI0008E48355|nr:MULTISPECIES: septal ring lytic transglycosylase RlpA family protein [unclassified Pseudoxanthomonas]PPJ41382.1 septal ring lytic transglycosylase RlpA family protein [Pseudoxanthomonas sp. KAs_5_3]SFV30463.1 rare lipoprotein A [Pseudoxanthomonas sp. YR558]
MKWLALPMVVVALAACSTAPKKAPPPPLSGGATTSPSSPSRPTAGKDCSRYAPAQEDLSTRGDYKAGGLYKPGVADTTPDHVPDLDCIHEPVVTAEARSRVGNKSPYTVLGKQYRVLDRVDDYVEQGTASYYGNKFHGRRTSNQEVYDMYAYSAAHKSLPLPSFARVTNLDNGKSVVVRVNDRGPFHEGRVIDLSYAAAVKLGITQRGTGRVEVRGLAPDGRALADAPAVSAPMATTPPATPSAMDALVDRLPQGTATTAQGFEQWMQANGVRVATGKPGGAATPVVTAPAAASVLPASAPATTSPLQLQVASFSSRDNADRALARLAAAGIADARLTDVPGNGGTLWRLRVGAPDAATAEALAGRIAGLGFGRPQLVRE